MHQFKREKSREPRANPDTAPVSLELVIFAFGEKGELTQKHRLIEKAKNSLITADPLNETWQGIKAGHDWEATSARNVTNESLDRVYAHLCSFLLEL